MPDFPYYYWQPNRIITPFHEDSLGSMLAMRAGSSLEAAATGALTDESITYIPFKIHQMCTVRKLLVPVAGASSGGNDMDIGVYDSQFNLLTSSGLFQSTGTVGDLQTHDVTDVVLAPGDYYMALKVVNVTVTPWRLTLTDEVLLSYGHIYRQIGSSGAALPAVGTPALNTLATTEIPVMGVQFDTVT
jgi:hypothetical protein